jgi:ABC-type multidrug transport system ATPase subunit
LDEPTRSLDAASTSHFWTTIQRLVQSTEQTTILLATHNFAEASAVASRLLFLHRGELLADRPVEKGESASSLRTQYFRLTGEPDDARQHL